MHNLVAALFVLLFSLQASAKDQDIAQLFDSRDARGTMVITSLNSGKTYLHNEARADNRYTVASTFKILNTLISVEEKAVAGKDDVFKWDGRVYSIANWNRDQTLESAFRVSCVWCYQELARRVGLDTYREYLGKFDYGVLREPLIETEFWLDGSLTISALEQIDFLKNIYLRKLPFSASSYETLQQIMLVEQTPANKIYAKTGLARNYDPEVGWYVGYVETKNDVWFFAMNMDIHSEKDWTVRLEITRKALQAKGIIAAE